MDRNHVSDRYHFGQSLTLKPHQPAQPEFQFMDGLTFPSQQPRTSDLFTPFELVTQPKEPANKGNTVELTFKVDKVKRGHKWQILEGFLEEQPQIDLESRTTGRRVVAKVFDHAFDDDEAMEKAKTDFDTESTAYEQMRDIPLSGIPVYGGAWTTIITEKILNQDEDEEDQEKDESSEEDQDDIRGEEFVPPRSQPRFVVLLEHIQGKTLQYHFDEDSDRLNTKRILECVMFTFVAMDYFANMLPDKTLPSIQAKHVIVDNAEDPQRVVIVDFSNALVRRNLFAPNPFYYRKRFYGLLPDQGGSPEDRDKMFEDIFWKQFPRVPAPDAA